jgi:hypothetical protein
MVFVLAIWALLMQFFVGEDPHHDFVGLLLPFLLVALPTMTLTAALAVLFETLPLLRGGVGNVIWFFVFSMGIGLPEISGHRWLDPMGLMTVGNSMMAAARAAIPGYKDGFSLTIAPGHSQVAEALRWQGVHWTPEHLLMRVGCLFAAVLITLLAALFFDRFDATRFLAPSLPKIKQRVAARAAASNAASNGSAVASRPGSSVHLTSLASAEHSNAFGRILAAELRLALKGFR